MLVSGGCRIDVSPWKRLVHNHRAMVCWACVGPDWGLINRGECLPVICGGLTEFVNGQGLAWLCRRGWDGASGALLAKLGLRWLLAGRRRCRTRVAHGVQYSEVQKGEAIQQCRPPTLENAPTPCNPSLRANNLETVSVLKTPITCVILTVFNYLRHFQCQSAIGLTISQ